MSDFKVGDKIIAIKNGIDYGCNSYKEIEHIYDYEKGWIGVIMDMVNQLSINVEFNNGRTMVSCNGCNFELLEEKQMEFKVGDLVEITKELDDGLGFRVGHKGKITSIINDCYSKQVYGVDYKWHYYEHGLKLIPDEKTMTKKEALKAMIDGYKVQSDLMVNSHSYWDDDAVGFKVKYNDGLVDNLYGLAKTDKWTLYKEILKPKFTIGQAVVCNNVKLAVITEVHEDKIKGKHSYTLCNNPLFPKSTFVKTEDELQEIPIVKKEEC